MGRHPYVIAHRGASASYPENTLIAFQAAVDLKVDWIELDVVTTADGFVIVSHDTAADRCTDGSGLFREMTLEQVKRLNAGSWFDSRFANECIPTLDEVLTLVEKTPIRLSIEIKGDTTEETLATARAVLTLLQDRRFLHRASIASFDATCLQAIRSWEPHMTVNLDPTPQDGSLNPDELCQQCLRCNANFMGHNYETLTPEIFETARAYGLAFWAWTVNDAEVMRHLIAMGVDGILSDDPKTLKEIVAAETV